MGFFRVEELPEDAAVREALRLRGIAARATDPIPAFMAVEKFFHKMEEVRFDSEGPGWAPLAPSTLAFKDEMGYPSDILVRTGALQESMLGYDNVARVMTPDYMFVGTTIEYAKYHQKGTPNMPARPLVHITEETGQVIAEIVDDYIVRGIVREDVEAGSFIGSMRDFSTPRPGSESFASKLLFGG